MSNKTSTMHLPLTPFPPHSSAQVSTQKQPEGHPEAPQQQLKSA
jgi:hypothetical protein